jgi:2'-5' RNA ligase/N-acetylglutamate synthase-like GNAT family acetyltransferase
MARHRLGVALLLPRHISHDVDGFRRGFGEPTDRVPPHITLLPGQDVEDVDAAVTHVRAVASGVAGPLHVVIGPVTTFYPITPVIYFAVSGPGADELPRLRNEVDAGPLASPPAEHDYVPHVTLSMVATNEQIEGALRSMDRYLEPAVLEGITVLELGEDATWRPIADAPFGDAPVTRTIGADNVTIAVHAHSSVAGAHIGRYRPLVVEAFVDGRSVGVARGRIAAGDVAWLDELVVVGEQRGTGIGGTLARALIEAARDRDATELRASRGATIAGFLVRIGFTQVDAKDFVLSL